MSDRSHCAVRVKSTSKKSLKKARKVIEEVMYPESMSTGLGGLVATDDETVLGTAGEVASALDALIEKGHVIAYRCTQDPCYEYLGWDFCHVPGVGSYSEVDCDSDGNLVFSAEKLDALVDEMDRTSGDLASALSALTQRHIRKAFAEYATPSVEEA